MTAENGHKPGELTHHGLWTDELDPDEELARLLGYPKAFIPAKRDEPDAIEAEGVEVSRNGGKGSLTLARESTELPADVALEAHGGAKLTESPASNPPTPSKEESMKEDEKAPVKNILQGYRKLNGAKSVTRKDNSVEAEQNDTTILGSRTLL
jgi:hypothetical protein